MRGGFFLKFNEGAAEMVDRWSGVVFVVLVLLLSLFGCTLEQQFLVSTQDRLALLQLRSSLGLRAKQWPVKSDPCTVWVGIQCNNGRVTSINISGFRRTRRGSQNPQFSVDALQNLTLLTSFNSSNFLLPGSIPGWLGLQLASLQVLDLSSCSITGVIPTTLGNLSSLAELYLSDNKLTGVVPSSLGQLFRLSVLDLSRNMLTSSIPESFAVLGNLTLLDMSANFLSGVIPPGIGTMSMLQFLNLSGNSLSSSIPAQLGDLSSLVELDLGFNSLTGSLPLDFRGLRNLRRMVIGNNILSGSLAEDLFRPLARLQILVLSRNGFTNDFPAALWSIPTMQFLDVSVNNFTGGLPNVTSSTNSSVLAINISHNMFYGNLPVVFRSFSFIDASSNYFQGTVPSNAHGNTSLGLNCLQNVTNQRGASECALFYSERGLVFDDFGSTNGTETPPAESHEKSHRKVIILAAVLGGVGIISLLVILFVLLICCKRRREAINRRDIGVGPVPASGSPPPPGTSLNFSILGDSFAYQQILKATDELSDSNLIKNGQSGDLFHGILEGGIPVVIKKVDLNSMVKKEAHMLELEFFNKVSHPRFIQLLGHCLENENEKFLVYKFMPNGDLTSSLFKKAKSDDDGLQSLDWITRLKIAIGAAEGLCFLHHECTPPLVHRDVHASSILLDDKFEVRLGSLSKVCAQEGDAHQNRITKLLRLPQSSDQGMPYATCAYDVYCFGKVLLELVTGKLDISSSPDSNMKEWLESTLRYISTNNKELVTNIVDTSLVVDEDLLEEVWAMAIVARSCLNPKPSRRPPMRYILKALENPLKVVREENTGSARLRTVSSRGSFHATLFSSWRHSSSDVAVGTSRKVERAGSFRRSATMGSQGSGQNGDGNGNGHSSSTRRHSVEIFPEPQNEHDVERTNDNN
ncbi:probable LRR receptor-like serine/threonine-protein kinase At2g16250 [Primulina eburnea]|uniref:probable LRR receptor-like serine/threonine-protein kinase At2g16250 n=1 Tax=Primulina eburnea TaxID=1245227 RepID=UPI003C6C1336